MHSYHRKLPRWYASDLVNSWDHCEWTLKSTVKRANYPRPVWNYTDAESMRTVARNISVCLETLSPQSYRVKQLREHLLNKERLEYSLTKKNSLAFAFKEVGATRFMKGEYGISNDSLDIIDVFPDFKNWARCKKANDSAIAGHCFLELKDRQTTRKSAQKLKTGVIYQLKTVMQCKCDWSGHAGTYTCSGGFIGGCENSTLCFNNHAFNLAAADQFCVTKSRLNELSTCYCTSTGYKCSYDEPIKCPRDYSCTRNGHWKQAYSLTACMPARCNCAFFDSPTYSCYEFEGAIEYHCPERHLCGNRESFKKTDALREGCKPQRTCSGFVCTGHNSLLPSPEMRTCRSTEECADWECCLPNARCDSFRCQEHNNATATYKPLSDPSGIYCKDNFKGSCNVNTCCECTRWVGCNCWFGDICDDINDCTRDAASFGSDCGEYLAVVALPALPASPQMSCATQKCDIGTTPRWMDLTDRANVGCTGDEECQMACCEALPLCETHRCPYMEVNKHHAVKYCSSMSCTDEDCCGGLGIKGWAWIVVMLLVVILLFLLILFLLIRCYCWLREAPTVKTTAVTTPLMEGHSKEPAHLEAGGAAEAKLKEGAEPKPKEGAEPESKEGGK